MEENILSTLFGQRILLFHPVRSANFFPLAWTGATCDKSRQNIKHLHVALGSFGSSRHGTQWFSIRNKFTGTDLISPKNAEFAQGRNLGQSITMATTKTTRCFLALSALIDIASARINFRSAITEHPRSFQNVSPGPPCILFIFHFPVSSRPAPHILSFGFLLKPLSLRSCADERYLI